MSKRAKEGHLKPEAAKRLPDTYRIVTYRPDVGTVIAEVDRATGKVVKFTPLGAEGVKHGK